MKTMIGLALFLFGVALLGMVAMVGVARREVAQSAWVIFEADGLLYILPTSGEEAVPVGNASTGFRSSYELTTDGIWHYYLNDGNWFRVRPIYPRPQRLPQMEVRSWFRATSQDSEWLLFQSEVSDKYWNLHRISADGKVLDTLTKSDAFYRFITLSPDQMWIYFSRYDNGIDDLYRMRWDGTSRTLIAADIDLLRLLGWSEQDGQMIVGENIDDELTIVLLNVENGNRTLLIDDLDFGLPKVSDDDKWMVYQQAETLDLIQLRSDGSGQREIIGSMNQYVVDWTPDGKRIVLGNALDGNESTVLELETGQTDTVVLPTEGINPYLSTWIPQTNCLIYDLVNDEDYTRYPEATCIDTGQTFHYSIPDGYSASLIGWSAEGRWGIWKVFDDYWGAIYRVGADGATSERISRYFVDMSREAFYPIIDLDWSAEMLSIIGLGAIGGSLCVGYWFWRS